MKIRVVTLFPNFFDGPLRTSIVERAISAGDLEVELIDLRAFGKGVHRQVDDAPFGGGAGMVMMVEPLFSALSPIADSHRVLLTPAGNRLEQATLDRLATYHDITLVCGRYEGVDERVAEHLIDEEISVGDFVVAGGEVAAATLIEGIARLLPGVVGNPESVQFESFRDGLLEEPHYTRPASFEAGDGETWDVPAILLSGDHGRIEAWRTEQRLQRTKSRRPDLL
jgi:tRNA (guanine37-N1)-methyltransferase